MGNWYEEALKLRTLFDSDTEPSALTAQIDLLEQKLESLKANIAGSAVKDDAEESHFNFSADFYAGERPAVITTRGLTKIYGSYKANDAVNITVKKGSIYGLIGRNGAGKTTWMKMVLGLTRSDGGTVDLGGDLNAVRKRIGYMIETPCFYDSLTAFQNLMYRAKLIELEDPEKAIDEALQKVGIAAKKHDRLKTFSLGQKQLLGIASAIMGDPELLILDEPVNGLDPVAIVNIRNLLLDMNRQGTTIVISSHILGELQKLATCYGFILQGRLVKELSETELMDRDINIEELFVKLAKGERA